EDETLMSAALVNEIIGWVAHAIYANNGEVSELSPFDGAASFLAPICGWPLVLALGWCNDLWANELRQSCKAKTRAVRF
ncbi:MAG: hypothetical protein ACO37E_14525, partial [Lutimaribacter sp.]